MPTYHFQHKVIYGPRKWRLIMRTTRWIPVVCALSILAAFPALGQGPQPARKLIYSLEPGEILLQPESTIFMSATKDSAVLVLAKGKKDKGPFFVVRDGKRKGPFTTLKDIMAAAYDSGDISAGIFRDCADYTPDQAGAMTAEITPQITYDGDRQSVDFNGKSYGPYLSVFEAKGSADGSRAYFTVNDKDRLWFMCSDGRKVPIAGTPQTVKLSPDGRKAIVACAGTLSPAEAEKLQAADIDKFGADQSKMYVYTIDGGKFGPFIEDFKDYWFSAASNSYFFLVGSQLYMNGAPTLRIGAISPCDFYPSADGKRYALFTYENLVFSDGQKYPYPLTIRTFPENGQTMIKWVALENKRDIVIYQRAI